MDADTLETKPLVDSAYHAMADTVTDGAGTSQQGFTNGNGSSSDDRSDAQHHIASSRQGDAQAAAYLPSSESHAAVRDQQEAESTRRSPTPSMSYSNDPAGRARESSASSTSASPSYAIGHSSSNGNHDLPDVDDSAYPSQSDPPSAPISPSKGGATILMASRKQNSACDACRSRKVRCNRDPGEARCNHCKAKNIDCTTLYVQWATSSAKRPTKRPRSSLHVPLEEKKAAPQPPEIVDAAVQAQDRLLNVLFQRDTEYAATDNQLYLYQSLPLNAPQSASGYTTRTIIPSSYLPGPKPAATTSAELHLLDRQRREDFVNDLVETFFSVVHARFPLLNPQLFRKRYYERNPEVGGPPPDVILALVIAWGAKFSENPLIAQDREESSSELKKAHSQAAMALNKGETEKANQITGVKGGIEQPILTVPQELRERGRNRIGEHLIWRAQDIMDRSRVSRVPSLENIQACFLMEALLLHPSIYYNGNVNLAGTPITANHRSSLSYTTGHWFYIAIKHLLDLGLNCKEKVMAIKDAALRGEIMFVWWSACWADSVAALYFQRHHILSPEQYNNDPHTADADNKTAAPHPLNSLDSYHSFYGSIYDALIFQRKLAAMYFAPRSYVEGVRFDVVVQIVEQLKKWRDDHLAKVGVPLPHWPAHWDYIAAVSACVSDINYHANWIILWRLIDEMGIFGTDRSDATSPLHQERLKRRLVPDPSTVPEDQRPDTEQVQTTLATIQEEALASALRIAGLTDILRTNQYLRLDPCNSLQSLELAAHMLIRFQRSEIDIIVAGFRQYALSYEDCFDKADLMEALAEAYMERARTDPGFVPGSALGLARERDAEGTVGEGIPELAIAAAALSNAAASANGVSEEFFDGQVEEVGRDGGAFDGMFSTAPDGLDEVRSDVALEGHD